MKLYPFCHFSTSFTSAHRFLFTSSIFWKSTKNLIFCWLPGDFSIETRLGFFHDSTTHPKKVDLRDPEKPSYIVGLFLSLICLKHDIPIKKNHKNIVCIAIFVVMKITPPYFAPQRSIAQASVTHCVRFPPSLGNGEDSRSCTEVQKIRDIPNRSP